MRILCVMRENCAHYAQEFYAEGNRLAQKEKEPKRKTNTQRMYVLNSYLGTTLR